MDLFIFVKFSSSCLFKLCTMWVKVAIGIRPLGFLDNCSTSCHESFPSCEDRSLHVLSTEYKCPSLRPVNQEETMISDTSSVLHLYCITHPVLRIQHPMKSRLTSGADSECCQGPTKSQQTSVLRAQSIQAVLHQLAQRLRKTLEAFLQLRSKGSIPGLECAPRQNSDVNILSSLTVS